MFRAGLAPTIAAARQLLSHRHVRLNGRVVNIPSIRVRGGDVIARPEWIAFDEGKREATVMQLPAETDVPFPVELLQVVELYSR